MVARALMTVRIIVAYALKNGMENRVKLVSIITYIKKRPINDLRLTCLNIISIPINTFNFFASSYTLQRNMQEEEQEMQLMQEE